MRFFFRKFSKGVDHRKNFWPSKKILKNENARQHLNNNFYFLRFLFFSFSCSDSLLTPFGFFHFVQLWKKGHFGHFKTSNQPIKNRLQRLGVGAFSLKFDELQNACLEHLYKWRSFSDEDQQNTSFFFTWVPPGTTFENFRKKKSPKEVKMLAST